MFTLVALALATPVAADVTSTCAPARLEGSLPSGGATEVAADAPVLLWYSARCGGPYGLWALTEDGVPVAEGGIEVERWMADGALVRLALPLGPAHEYQLFVESEGGEVEIPFSTGSAAYEPIDPAPPDLDFEVVDAFRSGGQRVVSGDATVGAPADRLVSLSLDGVQPIATWVSDGSDVTRFVQTFPGGDDAEACVFARAEGRDGDTTEWVAACDEIPELLDEEMDEDPVEQPYKPSRCDVGGTGGAPLWVLGALPWLRRRRAR